MAKKHRPSEERDSSPVIHQRNKIQEELIIQEPKWTEKQLELINLILDKNSHIIFLNGKSGTAKTFCSVFCGLKLLSQKRVSDFLYIRSVVESASKSLGFLPGESDEKFKPFITPLDDKLHEFLKKDDISKLYKDKRIRPLPYNYLRGCNWNAMFILADEAQNATTAELITLITRMGRFSKMVICGDISQSDINGRSGFKKIYDLFNTPEAAQNGIHCMELGIEHVMRSGIVKFILETLEKSNLKNGI